jgi:hypothetical protein
MTDSSRRGGDDRRGRPGIDILLPTIRWDDHVRGLLGYLAVLTRSGAGPVSVYIGDDSCNAEKHAYLNALRTDRMHVFAHPSRLGVHGNVAYLLNRATADYVQTIDDDDWIHADWLENAYVLNDDPGIAAVVGTVAEYRVRTALLHNLGQRFVQDDAVKRATDYVHYLLFEHNHNFCAIGLMRRKIMMAHARYVEPHPIQFWFHDQILAAIVLLSGKVLGTGAGLYVLDGKSDDPLSQARIQQMGEDIFASTVRSGLPAWHIRLLNYFHLAVEYATACLSNGLDGSISIEVRKQAANSLYAKIFGGWRQAIYEPEKARNEQLMEQQGIRVPVHAALANPESARQGIESLAEVVQRVNPALGARYVEFLDTRTHWRELE